MIYDCFNFYNELELLDIRLHELDSVVDKFVLVEATVTFTNQPKPLFYNENKHLFKKFHHKIIHIIVDDSPDVRLPWIIEAHQLSAVARGLKNCRPTDTILLSCVDEIPKKELVRTAKKIKGRHIAFSQIECHYFLNFAAINSAVSCTQLFSYKNLCSYQNPYIARFSPIDVEIPDGGWHFTFMGDIKRMQNKLAAFSHQEYNNDHYNTAEHILRSMSEKKDLLGRGINLEVRKDNFLPEYVQKNKQKFAQLLIDPQKKISLSIWQKQFLWGKEKIRILARTVRRSLQ